VGRLRRFLAIAVYSFRATFQWLTPSAYIATKVFFPVLQMAFFALIGGFGGSQPFSYYVLGNAMLVGYRPMYPIATGIDNERRLGMLPYLIAAPASRASTFFGRGLVHYLDGLTSIVLAFAIAVVVFGLDLSGANWVGLLAAMCVATYGAAAMGLALGPAAYVLLDASFLANLALFALILLSGANIPLSELPGALVVVSAVLPMTRSIEAARAFAAGAPWDASASLLLLTDVALGVVWACVGLLILAWIERLAIERGTLEGV
jgi:ABC-2 type transport system permease protein